jgi:CubicO group peptidase (beta-lactamase class C family)
VIRIAVALVLSRLVAPLLGDAAVIAQEAHAQSPSFCGAPLILNDGWRIDTPDAVGFDRSRLCGLADRLQDVDNVHIVIVARHGRLVFERYFAGYDEPWGHDDKRYEFDVTMKHDMRSVSKSVVTLLVGIANDRRLIDGVEAPALQFFPEMVSVATAGWAGIKLRDLLTISSGLAWDEARARSEKQ